MKKKVIIVNAVIVVLEIIAFIHDIYSFGDLASVPGTGG